MQGVLNVRLTICIAAALVVALVAVAGTSARESGAQEGMTDLDVLFIGAHPDDEAFGLSTYGQWNEYDGVETGVVTITRGEGGGNAVGPEEGPALGLIREAEERRAVGRAGIDDVYYLDKVDFYYTVSSPLTEQVWGREDTLARVVRIIRETRPEVIVTMNPSPTPGNHGNHQYAARLAVEGFYAAANPNAYPEQIQQEGLQPFRAARLFRGGATGTSSNGPQCSSSFQAAEPTDLWYGVWSGRVSERNGGKSWATVEREAQREYASQGWSVFPDVPTDPNDLGCDYFTQVDSRVPFTARNSSPTAMLEGALVPAAGGLPLGTEFYLTTSTFNVVGGESFTVTAHALNNSPATLKGASAQLNLPRGWDAKGSGRLGDLTTGNERTATFTVTPPSKAATNTRVNLGATLSTTAGTGKTTETVQVVSGVRGTVEPLPEVAQFRKWVQDTGVEQLDSLIKPLLPLGSGESRPVRVDLKNFSNRSQAGNVTIDLPAGFSADVATKSYSGIPAGGTGAVTFQVTNTDASLPTANQGGVNGDYNFSVTTTSAKGSGSQQAALNLVPVTTVQQASSAPTVDGVETPGEYAGSSLDLSRRWEGEQPSSAADASGSAKVVWNDDTLYLLVNVTDDVLGTVLPPEDAKRHWRTDSVEIAVDPRNNSANTSTTFKVGIFPTTDDPENGNPAFAYRDADNYQGPASETAPTMQVAATLKEPYTGYTLEAKVPMSELPAAVDPQRMGLNLFIYDSDTQDKTGQTRLGWSTFGGVQGDPYRWGHANLPGYTPPAGRSTTPTAPIIPTEATQSLDSPQSILQAAMTGVPVAGGPASEDQVEVTSGPTLADDTVSADLTSEGPGNAHLFAWTGSKVSGESTQSLSAGTTGVTLATDPADREALLANGYLLVGFESAGGGTDSVAARIK